MGEDPCVGAILGGERMAEQHDIHGGFGEQLLDVGDAGGGTNAEACLLEDEAAGAGELAVAAKDKYRSGSRA